MKTERKGEVPCAEKINTRVSSGCYVHRAFVNGDVFDPNVAW